MPNNGKIVIIDDHIEEVRPLFDILSKAGSGFLYFDGDPSRLPSSPIFGVRVIFLDIELAQSIGASTKNKASALASRLRMILGEMPSPYFIVFWTGHKEVISDVLKYIKKFPPLGYVEMNKPSARDLSDGAFDLSTIEEALNSALNECQAFQYFLQWESAISRSGSQVVDQMISIVPKKKLANEWSVECFKILANLYKVHSGEKQLSVDHSENTIGASVLLNKTHVSILDREVQTIFKKKSHALVDQSISQEVVAKLNAQLSIDQHSFEPIKNGSVHFSHCSTKTKNAIIRAVFNEGKVPKSVKGCSVVVAPPCDIAQAKFLKENDKIFLRLLHGLIFQAPTKKELNQLIIKSESQFQLGPFLLTGKKKPQYMILHFGSLSSVWISKSKSKAPAFLLTESLAADVQSKLANHANRLGNHLLPLA